MNLNDEEMDREALRRLAERDRQTSSRVREDPGRAPVYRVQVTGPEGHTLRHCGHDHGSREAAEECLAMLGRRPKWSGAKVARKV